jgi:uncharacterized membrane-anchored protein YitT (DUF2179 family)
MKEFLKRKITKEKLKKETKNVLLVLLGCFVLALADEIFIVPCNIVNGGVDSLGVILNHLWGEKLHLDITDIVIGISQVLLWILGCFTLGKKFSFHTLLGSVAFPFFYTIMMRLGLRDAVGITAFYARNSNPDGTPYLSTLMLSAIFGGALSGAGVALAYLGDGSTGGFDVISFLVAKYTEMKQDISGFIMDSSLIILGMVVFKSWELGLAGILSAFACALAVQYIYVYSNSFIVADIISDKADIIQTFVDEELGHGSTLINAAGGHKSKPRKLVRVVIYKTEMSELKEFIAAVDPKAFVVFLAAETIHGKGFEPWNVSKKAKARILSHYHLGEEETQEKTTIEQKLP